ncbi:MAG: F0F1 ATP synthase subunit B [Gammaproteobacteria bacterium]
MSINLTLIGQMITFTLLIWFTMKYVWPPLFDALEERKKKIAEGLAAAERGQEEMELAEKKAKTVLKEAKDQSSDIVTLAQKRANEIIEESKESAKKEGDRMLASAKAQIEQELQQTKEGLRKEVSALALKAAEQILQAEIDKGKHKEIVEKVAGQLGKQK